MTHSLRSVASRIAAAAVLLLPLLSAAPARAFVASRDILIKSPELSAAVYYLAADNKRYVFPNEKTYRSWFTGFGAVQTVSAADLASFPIGGNVTYRPGIKMVKINTDPKVYAVAEGGELRWVTSESIAATLYGSDWRFDVDDVPDAFFVNYHLGAPITSASDFGPHATTAGTTTINDDKNIATSGNPMQANTSPDAPADTQPQPQPLPPPVAADDGDSTAGIVIGGSDSTLARIRLTAVNESLRLTKASFLVATPAAVVSLSLYDGNTRVAGPVSVDGNGRAFFSNNIDFVISSNTYKYLTVRGIISGVGPTGVTTGANAKVTLKDTSGPYVFEMRSASGTSTVITHIPGGDVAGEDKIVRKTMPTVSLQALPSTQLMAGTQAVMRVAIKADAAGDLAFKTLTVHLNKSSDVSVAASSASSVRLQGGSQNLAGSADESGNCGAGAGPDCTLRIMFSDEQTIAAGDTRVYDVRADLGGSIGNGDYVSAILEGDDVLATGSLTNGPAAAQVRVAGTAVDLAWSDESAVPHSAVVGSSSPDWASGRYVRVVPTDPQTMTR